MKKTTHSLLVTSLILFCAGLLLTIVTSMYAKVKKIEVFDVEKKERTIVNTTLSIDQILDKSPDANFVKHLSPTKYSRLDLTSYSGKIVICPGEEDTQVVLEEANAANLELAVIGDALTVREVDPVGYLGFYIDKGGVSFKGLRHIFNPGNAINSDKIVTLKIPQSVALSQIDVFSSIGDITLDGVNANFINVHSVKGTIDVKNLTNATSKITINGNFTDVEMDNNLYSSCAISSRFGDIKTHVLENSNGSTILDLWIGDINVKTDTPTSLYKLSIATTYGQVIRNSENVGKTLNNDGFSAARISSSIFKGNFNLEFTGGDESSYVPPQPVTPEASQNPASSVSAS